MVTSLDIAVLAQQVAEPVMEQLDPPRRAAVVMALLGLVLTGLLLVTIAMLGAHWVRRLARHKPNDQRECCAGQSTAERTPLRDSRHSTLPDASSSETMQIDGPSTKTQADS